MNTDKNMSQKNIENITEKKEGNQQNVVDTHFLSLINMDKNKN